MTTDAMPTPLRWSMDGPHLQPLQGEALADLHARTLEMITSGKELHATLNVVALGIEDLMPGKRCAILLLDDTGPVLRCGAAPNVSAPWRRWIDDLVPGPMSGGCGTAVHLGEPVISYDVADDPKFRGGFRSAALDEGIRACWSTPVVSGDGTILGTFAIYGSEPAFPQPNDVALVTQCTDLTAAVITNHKLHQKLSLSEERFRRAFDSNVVGMAILDEAGTCIRVNDTLCQLTSSPERHILGQPVQELFTDDSREPFAKQLSYIGERLADGAQLDGRLRTAGGGWIPAHLSISGLWTADRELTGFCLHVLNISERLAAERAREEQLEAEVARRTAEEASRAKSVFLSGMTHEVQTPMAVIVGFSELLETLDLDEERRQSAYRKIGEAAKHVISLVDDVLDIAKIEAGVIALQDEDIDLSEEVAGIVEMLEPVARDREVSLRYAPIHPSIRMHADRRRVREVLLNIVSNAIKYNRFGGFVDIEVVDGPVNEGVLIRISDEGPGLPTDADDQLFEPFNRLGVEVTGVQGSGLGLPLSRALMEAMGGSVRLRGRPRCGVVVDINFPPSSRVG
ncbi:GAF domain-containing sensor histidine kinase [Rhodococcus pyridinivorans]|uniref:histidine kinase n=1 Tax=Rhodococcus sp. NS1 TaxID=402236 RepID=A0A097SPP5_9NOCA|nr:ATP-binding protein [Rhodococcus pyridinivorans]AIU93494.1 hypothetical protein LRS1606.60 [Rhodococcus sp. NS1]